MQQVLEQCELFRGLDRDAIRRVTAIARREALSDGERLFTLGMEAERVYVILQGSVNISLPLPVRGALREVTLESKGVGSALGWSAFVPPQRFRLSAQASGAVEVAAFERPDLEALLEGDPELGYEVMLRVAQVIAQRLLTVQALWARQLQQKVSTVE